MSSRLRSARCLTIFPITMDTGWDQRLAEPLLYPKLRRKFGNVITYRTNLRSPPDRIWI